MSYYGIKFDAIIFMNKKLSILFFLTIAVFISSFTMLFSQNDSKDSKGLSLFADDAKRIKPLNFSLLDTTVKESILNFKPKNTLLGFKSNVNKYFDPFKEHTKPKVNFMTDRSEVEDDVLVKRSFNGKDMSNPKIRSDFSLGTFSTTSNKVRIEVRDYSLVDGDRIKVYLNERVLNSNVMLNSLAYSFTVTLRAGYNRIDIEALNEGYSGPNTAEIRVFDEKGNLMSSQEWNIRTGERATLGVVKN